MELKPGDKVRVVSTRGPCPYVGLSGFVESIRDPNEGYPGEENRDTILGPIVTVIFPLRVNTELAGHRRARWVFHPMHGDELSKEELSSEERMAMNVAAERKLQERENLAASIADTRTGYDQGAVDSGEEQPLG